ncbi:SDR family oxidoreductase [Oscillatoria sp. FACHB-1406]|uniref:SDR family oxidoreductase n=1 Tax=Oscillatoria sp. FACHB-1406 TaxID=2692846 RepID=UPI001687AB32|nr:SDR family oxidoreductase [Oscillatoria sp. FACHB-1406]MBD2579333.1 SDR family oxidoreductase [Oscillatoria sp. FACHB-1406]
MTETILVTAANSNVGREVVKHLVAMGAKVRAAVRSRASELPPEVERVEFDLNRPDTVRSAFAGVNKAFLMTPLAPNLVEFDLTCLEAAKASGIEQIVKLSVMGVDTEPDLLLGQSHGTSESAIASSGIPYTFLRPNSFYQNYIIYTSASIKAENAFYLPLGDGKISFIDIRDVAAVAARVLMQGGYQGQAYTLTGSEALNNSEVASILSAVLGRTITYVDIPPEIARQAMQSNQIPEIQIDMVLGLYDRQKAGDYATILPTVQDITGKPPIPFEQFVRDYVDAFKVEY